MMRSLSVFRTRKHQSAYQSKLHMYVCFMLEWTFVHLGSKSSFAPHGLHGVQNIERITFLATLYFICFVFTTPENYRLMHADMHSRPCQRTNSYDLCSCSWALCSASGTRLSLQLVMSTCRARKAYSLAPILLVCHDYNRRRDEHDYYVQHTRLCMCVCLRLCGPTREHMKT